jgi:hypothetical protein
MSARPYINQQNSLGTVIKKKSNCYLTKLELNLESANERGGIAASGGEWQNAIRDGEIFQLATTSSSVGGFCVGLFICATCYSILLIWPHCIAGTFTFAAARVALVCGAPCTLVNT